jgi:hypothetical protein
LEISGEHRCTGCCNPKALIRAATKAECERGNLPHGAKISYGKGSVFAMARGLKRHQASCRPARDRSRKGTKTLRASEWRKRVAQAEA